MFATKVKIYILSEFLFFLKRKPISNPDEEILQQLIQMGFKREEIIDDLKNGKEKSHHWVFYYLMLDQKEKQEKLKKSNGKL